MKSKEEAPKAENELSSARKLAYMFMTLPYHQKIRVAIDLGVYEELDADLVEQQKAVAWFTRVRERKLLKELWDKTASHYPEKLNMVNPFDVLPSPVLEPKDSKTVSEEGGKESHWVKATERLPILPGVQNKVIIKWRGLVAFGFKNYDEANPRMYFEYGNQSELTNDDVLWLDESLLSPLPSETQEELWDEIRGYINVKTCDIAQWAKDNFTITRTKRNF